MIKIYYIECTDDELLSQDLPYEEGIDLIFTRGSGYINNYFSYRDFICYADESQSEISRLMTNDLDILEYGKDDAWNHETKRFEIYIKFNGSTLDNSKFINVHDLTPKEIRKSHNIRKMYVNGSFIIPPLRY